jgi:hypothetical protein
VNVVVDGLESNLSISQFRFQPNTRDQTLAINGPPDAVLHVELHRLGESTWIEATADDIGYALVEVDSGYELRGRDRLDLTAYQVSQGHTIHQAFSIDLAVYLPIILRNG